jgi:hypothetical protein
MTSVYGIVTEKIIKQLESGVAPWRKPWTSKTPANLVTQKEYRGLNVLTLASQGFPSRFWRLEWDERPEASCGTHHLQDKSYRAPHKRPSLLQFQYGPRFLF